MLPAHFSDKIKTTLEDISYTRLIMFGSYARGQSTDNSDIDLLVVVDENLSLLQKKKMSTMLRQKFAKKMMDVDVIIKDQKEVAYLKDKKGSVVRNALLEGISL